MVPPLVFRRRSSGVVASSGRHSDSAPSIVRKTLSLPDSHARVYIVDRRYTWGIHERSPLGLDLVQPMERALFTRAVSSSKRKDVWITFEAPQVGQHRRKNHLAA